MALLYFYDTTEADENQLSDALKQTDHSWKFVSENISLENSDPEAEVISVFVGSNVTREIIERMPKLRLIACRSTGFNNIDIEAAEERNITIVNVPTYGEHTVAEYAFTLLLSLVKKLPDSLHKTQKDQPDIMGFDLKGKTFGVIGTGHIGQHALKIAHGFGMKTIAYDAFPKQELEGSLHFSYVSLEDLLKNADIISLHAPYLPTTHHIINEERINMMKNGSVLINTARGSLIDTKALVEAISSGKLGGAALDVVEGEEFLDINNQQELSRNPRVKEAQLEQNLHISILSKLPNVIITPHNAFNTFEAVQRINSTTAKNIIDFWYGSVPNKVQKPEKTLGKLLIARHTESEWNATGQWTGRTDTHLSEKGFRDAVTLGQKLKELDIAIDIAYCSEQIRTRETLEGILGASQQFSVDIVRNGAVNERDYGDYTGKNKWEMKEILGEEHFNAVRRGWDVGVPGGETLKTVYERVIPFYKEVLFPIIQSGKNVLLVAHGNSIRSLMKYLENISDEDVEQLEMLFGEIVIYSLNNEGRMKEKSSVHIESEAPNA